MKKGNGHSALDHRAWSWQSGRTSPASPCPAAVWVHREEQAGRVVAAVDPQTGTGTPYPTFTFTPTAPPAPTDDLTPPAPQPRASSRPMPKALLAAASAARGAAPTRGRHPCILTLREPPCPRKEEDVCQPGLPKSRALIETCREILATIHPASIRANLLSTLYSGAPALDGQKAHQPGQSLPRPRPQRGSHSLALDCG